MNNIIDINPRLKANQTAQADLTQLYTDHVCSDKALERIARELRMLDEKMIKAEHVALYGEDSRRRLKWSITPQDEREDV